MMRLSWMVVAAALAVGCGTKEEPEPVGATEEAPQPEEPAEAEPVVEAREEDDELATPEDFEAEAEAAITAENLAAEVARLEAEIGE